MRMFKTTYRLSVISMPTFEYEDPEGPMRNGTTYIVRPFIELLKSGVSFSRAAPGAIQLFVGPASSLSVVLTKVLLPHVVHVPLGEKADAKLLIGDAALRSAFEDPTPHYDLGRLWLERTGLPMVFAVWASPEPVAEGVAELEHSLVASVRLARTEPQVLAREASARYGYPAGYLARYFEKLRYSFGPRERAGLYTFFEMARDVGQLDHVPELRFVQKQAVEA